MSLWAPVPCTAVPAMAGYPYLRRCSATAGQPVTSRRCRAVCPRSVLAGTGGDPRTIALTPAARILFAVLTLPPASSFFPGGRPEATASPGPPPESHCRASAAQSGLGGCARLSRWLGCCLCRRLLLLSAGIHLADITAASPPFELMAAAQVAIGVATGTRLAGAGPRSCCAPSWEPAACRYCWPSPCSSHCRPPGPPACPSRLCCWPLLLTYAPDGLAGASLLALTLGLDAATHRALGIVPAAAAAPLAHRLIYRLIYRLTGRRRRSGR
ncbi:MAG: AbrB family transcriptional regulator [Rhodospirillales bacterium]|nr:AbrB family transcriptional regulator [Rhodospirillales bacterium]